MHIQCTTQWWSTTSEVFTTARKLPLQVSEHANWTDNISIELV